mmetsp:Transcript_29716/g.83768  ORF Transcript_29716/g.83768 Transcript_29716/m.83768 type:complete len:159 (+) Transcript_29716:106-582(+)
MSVIALGVSLWPRLSAVVGHASKTDAMALVASRSQEVSINCIVAARTSCYLYDFPAASTCTSVLPSQELIDVEYCVLCQYRHRYVAMVHKLEALHPGRFSFRENPKGVPRDGSFEVTWRLDRSTKQRLLWSKLQTGEPTTVQAAEAIAEVINMELLRI